MRSAILLGALAPIVLAQGGPGGSGSSSGGFGGHSGSDSGYGGSSGSDSGHGGSSGSQSSMGSGGSGGYGGSGATPTTMMVVPGAASYSAVPAAISSYVRSSYPKQSQAAGGKGGSGFSSAGGNSAGYASAGIGGHQAAVATSSSALSGVTSAAVAASGCTATAAEQISGVVASCTAIVLDNISLAASTTLDLSALQTGTTVTFSGTTSFGYTADEDFDPIVIGGTDITITGASGNIIDGNGAAYWDGQGSNGGTDKPDHFIVLKDLVNGKISNLNIQNWPTHCFEIEGAQGLTISGLTLDNSAGDAANSASDGDPAAHNTDGFDISSSDSVTLSNTVVKNQDDCVAITSGSNIVVTGMTCSGGHGLSIGSVGGKSNNTVSGITFSDSTITDSENGCRIKSNSDTTGTIENVTYKNIVLKNISDYGIDVQQDYLNGGATGSPTDGVTISGITFDTVTGTTSGDDAYNYYILCGDDSCSDFTFTGVSITGGAETSTCNFPTTGCPS